MEDFHDCFEELAQKYLSMREPAATASSSVGEKGLSRGTGTSLGTIPMMSCRSRLNRHRPKRNNPIFSISACVARPVSKLEIKNCKDPKELEKLWVPWQRNGTG